MLGKIFVREDFNSLPQLPLAFRDSELHTLRLSDDTSVLPLWRHLTHHIKRYPHDLRAHVQRILLTQQDELSSRLAGSLQDLYLVLGDAGSMLRENMLDEVRNSLSEEDIAFFENWQAKGYEAGDDHQWREGSVLSNGFGQIPQQLITAQQTKVVSEYADVLEEVYACLEYGQIDIAQELLEKECLQPNPNPQAEFELLNIYQYTRNKDALDSMATQLEQTGKALSPEWQEKQRESQQW